MLFAFDLSSVALSVFQHFDHRDDTKGPRSKREILTNSLHTWNRLSIINAFRCDI